MTSRNSARRSGAETNARILEVSLALFIADSFQGASVRDIADEVGVSQPTLYYHFGSKDGILAAIIEPLLRAGETLLAELSSLEVDSQALADHALEGYYDLIVAHLDVFQFVETDRSVRSHPDAGHRLAEQAGRFLGLLAASQGREGLIGAAAALGALRRPLRLHEIDPVKDRESIIRRARAALLAVG